MLARGLFPSADDVHLGADAHGVPRLIIRIQAVEVVVMHAHGHEISRAHFDIQIHQLIGLPSVNHPVMADVLVAVFRRMAEVVEVVIILRASLQIHAARIPIALLGHGLRVPVRPRAELGVAPPFRHGVNPADILPVGGIGTRRDRTMAAGSKYPAAIPSLRRRQRCDQCSPRHRWSPG